MVSVLGSCMLKEVAVQREFTVNPVLATGLIEE